MLFILWLHRELWAESHDVLALAECAFFSGLDELILESRRISFKR